MTENELLFAVNLPPQKAIEYFKDKGYAFGFNWQDVWQEQHAHAFTVAKMMQLDLLQDTREIVNQFIEGKMPYTLAAQNLETKLRAKGWWGKQDVENPDTGEVENVQLGSPWRIKKILETNMIVSLSAGRYRTQIEKSSFAPWWRYRDQEDNRTRKKHRALGMLFHNAVLHYTDPFWNTYYPPNDWGCRCWVDSFTDEEVERKGFIILKNIPDVILNKNKPGKGWNYNPGKSRLWDSKGNLFPCPDNHIFAENNSSNSNNNCVKVLSTKTWKDFDRPDIKELSDDYFLDEPLKIEPANSKEEALIILKKTLGMTNTNVITVNTPIGNVPIMDTHLSHIVDKRTDTREKYANYLIPTLQNPFEIYLTNYEDGYRKQFIGLFKGKRDTLVVVRINKDGSLLMWNFMQVRKKGINLHRVGDALLYFKK